MKLKKKLKFEEALKQTDQGEILVVHGPGTCFHDGNENSLQIVVGEEDGEAKMETVAEIWSTSDPRTARLDAALLGHCRNLFPDVLRALRRRIERAEDEYPRDQWEDEGLVRDREILERADTVLIPGVGH
jgi:hypothetical protein